MRRLMPFAAIFALLLAGCASTDTEMIRQRSENTKLPYPKAIYVYDFAVSLAEVPADSAAAPRLSGAVEDPNETAKRDQLEHQIADVLATRLVADLQDLGLPAVRWRGTPPKNDDAYTIEGQFLTIDEGNAAKQLIIGFGAGGTEVRVLTQAYHLNDGRKELLGEAEVSAESSKAPGLAATLPVGAAISGASAAAAVSTGVGVVRTVNSKVKKGAEDTAEAIVELLKPKMQEQGWL
ncbi:MAG TPA: DUF4410 domain-containing protein [Dongiaceae bacterium]|jgi:hypothetical protein|nr:DUF4410 domain-containing protein [Dongiaceae bacterium]